MTAKNKKSASTKKRSARVVPMRGVQAQQNMEPTPEQIINSLQNELQQATHEVGQLTLRNKRQEHMIIQLQMRLEELENPTGGEDNAD